MLGQALQQDGREQPSGRGDVHAHDHAGVAAHPERALWEQHLRHPIKPLLPSLAVLLEELPQEPDALVSALWVRVGDGGDAVTAALAGRRGSNNDL